MGIEVWRGERGLGRRRDENWKGRLKIWREGLWGEKREFVGLSGQKWLVV